MDDTPIVDKLAEIWSIIPTSYTKHTLFLSPREFIDAYRVILKDPPTLKEYNNAKETALKYYDAVSKSFRKNAKVSSIPSSTRLVQQGGTRFVLLQQIFFTLLMLFLFVYYSDNIQDYGVGIMEQYGPRITQEYEPGIMQDSKRFAFAMGRFAFVSIFGDYTNPCDMILMLINVLIYIVLVIDMVKVYIQNRDDYYRLPIGQIFANVWNSSEVIYSPGNTVNWLMEIQRVDAPKILPELQNAIVGGIQRAAPRFSESLTRYLARDHHVMTVGFFAKHLLQWTPTIFSTVVYSMAFKVTVTNPIANILRSIDPEHYENCAAYFPSVTGGRRKTRKRRHSRKGTRKNRV